MIGVSEKIRKVDLRIVCALVIFLIAISLRLSYQSASIVDQPIRADAQQYFFTAYNLFHNGIYSIEAPSDKNIKPRTIWRRTPGYPLFLYPFFYFSKTTNEFLINVTLSQAILGSMTCVLAFFLALCIFPIPLAFIVGLLTALSPHLIAMDDYLLSESLFTFTIVLAALITVISFQKRSLWLVLLSGALFCLSATIREITGFLGLFMILMFLVDSHYWKAEKKNRLCIALLFFSLGIALVQIPYSYTRNTIIASSASVPEESAWRHMVNGSDPDMRNFFINKVVPEVRKHTERMIEDKGYGLSVLFKRFREDPVSYLRWYVGGKLLFMWKWDSMYIGDVYQYPMVAKGFHQENWLSGIHRVMLLLHWPLFAFAIFGTLVFILNWRYRRLRKFEDLLFVPVLVFLYFSIVLTIMMPLPRYAIPIRPFIYILGCYGLMIAFLFFKQFSQKKRL